MSKLKEKGVANGVVLPQESVQHLQEINQAEYQERVKKAEHDQQIKSVATTAAPKEPSRLTNGLSSPENNKSSNTYIRPRPTPSTTDPSPFTRHMSLPYRSKPMSGGHGFNQMSSTYKALTDDLAPPRFPAGTLSDESSSFESASFNNPGNSAAGFQSQPPPSQADMWLAAVATEPASSGLLATTVHNPFSTAAASTALTAPGATGSAGFNQTQFHAATHHTTIQHEQKPNPFGEDTFEQKWSAVTVAHNVSSSSQGSQPNPFAVDFGGVKKEQFV